LNSYNVEYLIELDRNVPEGVVGAQSCLQVDSHDVLLAQAIGEIVVKAFKGNDVGLWDAGRGDASIALLRQISMYLSHVVCGLNFTEIGTAFKRDRTTVSHACCVVEDRRDDLNFDEVLDTLEYGILCLLDTGLYSDFSDQSGGERVEAGHG